MTEDGKIVQPSGHLSLTSFLLVSLTYTDTHFLNKSH